MQILVTGGAGYIGSHVVKSLLKKGHQVVIFDNLSRGHIESIPAAVQFEKVDLLNYNQLTSSLKKYKIDAVIHFAAFAYVGESVVNPQLYYNNNLVGSFNLLNALKENSINRIVFSSTCSVYGNPIKIPISEDESTKPINPYAWTKLTIEQILKDYDTAFGFRFISLRYFNAAGASSDCTIGESHNPEPHLIPNVLSSTFANKNKLQIFGNDYPTHDGTCIRDYIHVEDLADAHVKALKYVKFENKSDIINLGTGKGNSVKEVINVVEEVTGRKVNSTIVKRREGDPAILVADNKKAKDILGWGPKYDIKGIIKTAWQWYQNPKY
jgi:UDP-glucose 4-epimerase